MLIKNGCVLHFNRLESGKDVRIQAGKISAVAEKLTPQAGEEILDANGLYVLPGLIDLHTHGLKDVFVQDGGWREFSRLQAEQGVTGCLPTLFAGPEVIILSLQTALQETEELRLTPNLLGFRLEMPYLTKPGSQEEAVEYVAYSIADWKQTQGAIEWLKATTHKSTATAKKLTQRTPHQRRRK